MNRKKGESGFTLIETMIVITVIGIITALALPKFKYLLERARIAQAKENGTYVPQPSPRTEPYVERPNGSSVSNIDQTERDRLARAIYIAIVAKHDGWISDGRAQRYKELAYAAADAYLTP